MKTFSLAVFICLFSFLLAGCGGSSGSMSGSSSLQVSMVDTPFSLSGQTVTAVNLGISEIEVIGNGQKPTVVDSFSPPDVVNILNYTSSSSPLTFPSSSIPSGTYSQVRFILNTADTTITVNGTTSQLFVPSGTCEGFSSSNQTCTDSGNGQGTAGVKVNLSPHLNAVSGGVYAFILDFNAQESIVLANGQYIMKPVIVASATNIAGSLSGTVLNQAGSPVSNALVEAEQNGAVINTGVTDASGGFTINSLLAGTYNLVVLNQYTTVAGTSETASGYDNSVGSTLDVSGSFTVTAGNTTSTGNITD
jgi:hypothetical protein